MTITNWQVKKIKEIANFNELNIINNYEYQEIKYIDIASVNQGRIVEKKILKLDDAPSRAKRILRNNDIIISTVRPNLRHYAFIKDIKENTICSTGFVVITPKEVDPIFLYYYLTQDSFVEFLTQIAESHTSAYPAFNPDIIENSEILLPELNKQRRIGKILYALDKKIDLNNKIINSLEQVSQLLFKHWFIDFEFPDENNHNLPYKSSGGEMIDSELGKIPKGWKVSNIGKELITVLGGTPDTKNQNYWRNGDIPWINSGEINKFRIVSPTAYITQNGLKYSATKLMPKGTTVIAITGATLGQVSRIEIDCCANQSVVGVLESKKLPSEYIYFWIKNKINEIISFQTGGAQQHINKDNINSYYILVPLKEVIDIFDKNINPIFKLIALNCFESQTLSQILDSLLPKLMTGKIRVSIEDNDSKDSSNA